MAGDVEKKDMMKFQIIIRGAKMRDSRPPPPPPESPPREPLTCSKRYVYMQSKRNGEGDSWLVACLLAQCPSKIYLRDGSALTIVYTVKYLVSAHYHVSAHPSLLD